MRFGGSRIIYIISHLSKKKCRFSSVNTEIYGTLTHCHFYQEQTVFELCDKMANTEVSNSNVPLYQRPNLRFFLSYIDQLHYNTGVLTLYQT
jgi:hypothetical protein